MLKDPPVPGRTRLLARGHRLTPVLLLGLPSLAGVTATRSWVTAFPTSRAAQNNSWRHGWGAASSPSRAVHKKGDLGQQLRGPALTRLRRAPASIRHDCPPCQPRCPEDGHKMRDASRTAGPSSALPGLERPQRPSWGPPPTSLPQWGADEALWCGDSLRLVRDTAERACAHTTSYGSSCTRVPGAPAVHQAPESACLWGSRSGRTNVVSGGWVLSLPFARRPFGPAYRTATTPQPDTKRLLLATTSLMRLRSAHPSRLLALTAGVCLSRSWVRAGAHAVPGARPARDTHL